MINFVGQHFLSLPEATVLWPMNRATMHEGKNIADCPHNRGNTGGAPSSIHLRGDTRWLVQLILQRSVPSGPFLARH
jgi:hypothetical protein